ncbi:MAG TPA: sugar phosphate isomerase/epimerase [Devosiaceae bacterium]|nr:sugar phosphate isomerase/epimerase [Devosiaceae bacterium]
MTDFSFQLYSARKISPIDAILPLLAGEGYRQVEGFGGVYGDAEGFAEKLKENGLSMPTAHFGLDLLENPESTIRIANTLGVRTVICPAVPWDKRDMDEAGWDAMGEALARFTTIYQGAGFDFAWHNHDFEFTPTASGKMPMDILLAAAPGMLWEMDVAWLISAKQAPFDWFDRYGPRITAVHVKDIALPGQGLEEDGWADVGFGEIDWPTLFAEIRANTAARYFVIEHDNPSDVGRFASRSIASASNWR